MQAHRPVCDGASAAWHCVTFTCFMMRTEVKSVQRFSDGTELTRLWWID